MKFQFKHQYNHDYFPPAPFIDVTFVTPAETLRSPLLPAFIDSGADGCIVPLRYLEEIEAPPTQEKTIRSQWGDRHIVMLYLVDVQIGDLTFPGIEVVGDEIADEVILGRNLLNRLQVLLDGRKETVEITE